MSEVNVAVLYGGWSVEYEVSVLIALQVLHNLDIDKYLIYPVYISKDT